MLPQGLCPKCGEELCISFDRPVDRGSDNLARNDQLPARFLLPAWPIRKLRTEFARFSDKRRLRSSAPTLSMAFHLEGEAGLRLSWRETLQAEIRRKAEKRIRQFKQHRGRHNRKRTVSQPDTKPIDRH